MKTASINIIKRYKRNNKAFFNVYNGVNLTHVQKHDLHGFIFFQFDDVCAFAMVCAVQRFTRDCRIFLLWINL